MIEEVKITRADAMFGVNRGQGYQRIFQGIGDQLRAHVISD